jgi:uncharacterized pyridoxamine 5'-phosphate oxidase family protein
MLFHAGVLKPSADCETPRIARAYRDAAAYRTQKATDNDGMETKMSENILSFLNAHPIFFLATSVENQPRVRVMRLYRADRNGIIFNTSSAKSLHRQLQDNPFVELCFYDHEEGVQVRIRGKALPVDDPRVRNEMAQTAPALAPVIHAQVPDRLAIYRISQGTARVWKTDDDFIPKLMSNVELSSIWMAMYDGAPR